MSDHEADDAQAEVWAVIAQTAYELAVAEVDEDDERTQAARDRSAEAIGNAVRSGQPLSAIVAREAEGKRRATEELGKRLLRAAVASARRREEAIAAYERDVRRASRLLPDREVAEAIGVAPGTVRAITRRPATELAQTNGDLGHEGEQNGGEQESDDEGGV